MRIGVVCEGPTVFFAIESFFRNALSHLDIESEFVAIQPEMDNTSPEAGWGNVLLWLDKNLPTARIIKYFGGGLFGGNLGFDPLDCLLIQLDTDILENDSFKKHIKNNYGLDITAHQNSLDRADEISTVLRAAWRENELTAADQMRHVPAPAVESTEAWCIAAFHAKPQDFETFSGQVLVDEFMASLEISEGRHANRPYANIDKNPKRRRRFCQTHENGGHRVATGCAQFQLILTKLQGLA